MARRWATSDGVKSRGCSVWTLRTPTIRSFHDEGHRQHRGDEPLLVDAADPQEALVLADVRDHERLARLGHATGHARPRTAPAPGRSGSDRGRSSRRGSGSPRRGRAGTATRRSPEARRASRRRPSRAARPMSRAVVAMRATRCRKRSWSELLLGGAGSAARPRSRGRFRSPRVVIRRARRLRRVPPPVTSPRRTRTLRQALVVGRLVVPLRRDPKQGGGRWGARSPGGPDRERVHRDLDSVVLGEADRRGRRRPHRPTVPAGPARDPGHRADHRFRRDRLDAEHVLQPIPRLERERAIRGHVLRPAAGR